MITIPAEILDLLKSQQQIGPDRPVAMVVFGGQPSGTSLKDPNAWTDWVTFTGRSGYTQTNGNMEECSDRRAIIAYYADDQLMTDEAGNLASIHGTASISSEAKAFGNSSLKTIGDVGFATIDDGPITDDRWLYTTMTFDFRVYFNSAPDSTILFVHRGYSGNNWFSISAAIASGVMRWTLRFGNLYGINNIEHTIPLGEWHHLEFVRNGNTYYFFDDGQLVHSSTLESSYWEPPTGGICIGHNDYVSLNGYMDEFRISKVARHTANFTPPVAQYEMDSDTISLMHFDDPNWGKRCEIAYADSVAEVLNQTKIFGDGILLDIGEPFEHGNTSMARIDGKLCMVLFWTNESEGYHKAEYWRDSDGNGTDFQKVGLISDTLRNNFVYEYGGSMVTIPTRLPNGNLVVILPYWYGLWERGKRVFYSTDDGETWIAGAYWVNYYVGTGCSLNPLIIGDDSFILNDWGSSGVTRILKFTGSGAIMSVHDWVADWSPDPGLFGWSKPCWVGWYYMASGIWYMSIPEADNTIVLRQYAGPEPPDETTVATQANWEEVVRIGFSDSYTPECVFTETAQTLVLQHSIGDRISGAGTELTSNPLRPKRVVVSRTKGGASQLSVQFANTNGQYAPDPAGPWQFVMWPNNTVRAEIGYGTYLPQVFRGSIDDVDMDTPPQMISITARDRSKLLLDQMCQWTWDGTTYYDGAWASQDPEGIALTLFTMAGFAEADIVYDVTGITIPEFRFNQQTYADLLQKLAEMAGCEWYCDEDGKAYFKLVTYPEATPVYSFVAGVDIFSLGYRISDAEIYRWVVVTAQGPEDEGGNRETISVRVEWSAADYYGLPAHKTLYVTASDLVQDEAGCLEIANRMLTAMTTKPRQVNFVCVGIPNVQIGDCIQVTEASSTISEIYRVYDFEHQFDAEGSPVFATAIKCYWYAHG